MRQQLPVGANASGHQHEVLHVLGRFTAVGRGLPEEVRRLVDMHVEVVEWSQTLGADGEHVVPQVLKVLADQLDRFVVMTLLPAPVAPGSVAGGERNPS
jgi:hypothetical protein